MDGTLFHRFKKIAYETAGIHLAEGKEALVAARVAKRQRQLGIPDQHNYLRYLESDQSGDELTQFLDAISTNFTSFFREPDHFEFFDAVLHEAIGSGRKRLRFWCAACSSGEEPYSMAIRVLEADRGRELDVRILATDISTRVLGLARRGVYDAERLAPLSSSQLPRYFKRVRDASGEPLDDYEAAPELRSMIVFSRLNLSKTPLPMKGPLDVVFCRNVIMYFDRAVRQRLIADIERLLRPGGYLLTGHAETLTGLDTRLPMVRPSIYQRATQARGDER